MSWKFVLNYPNWKSKSLYQVGLIAVELNYRFFLYHESVFFAIDNNVHSTGLSIDDLF